MDIELLQKKVNDLSILMDITRAMVREKDLRRLLDYIIVSTTKIMGAERTTLFIVDKKKKELVSYIAQGVSSQEIRVAIGRGISGYVAEKGEVVNIPDAYADPRFNQETDKKTGYRTRTILTIPMRNYEGEITGVLQALNKKNGIFTQYDEELMVAIGGQAAIAVENATLYEQNMNLLKSMIQTLAATIDARDPVTSGHSERVAYFSLKIGRSLGLDEKMMKLLEYSSWLHDIGKIGVRDDVLLKPGKFSDEERKKIEMHAVYTREILSKFTFPDDLSEVPYIASHHHEKLNGKGYPDGKKGDEIGLLDRIIAVADIYDALTAYDRPYKKALPIKKALEILREDVERESLDRKIVEVFEKHQLYLYERRQSARINSHTEIEYKMITEEELAEKKPEIAKSVNIGPGGLLFVTKQYIPVDSFLEVTLYFPDLRMDVVARVARVEKNPINDNHSIGISFIDLSPETWSRISQYL